MPAIPPKPQDRRRDRTLERTLERDVKAACLLRLGRDYPQIRVFPTPRGVFFTADGRRVNVGVDGQSDFTGIIGPRGIALALEFKSTRGIQRDRQKDYQREWEARGGAYIMPRSADDMVAQMQVRGLV